MSRRIPPAREVVLTQRNIFIFPTGSGFAFLALLLALLIAASITKTTWCSRSPSCWAGCSSPSACPTPASRSCACALARNAPVFAGPAGEIRGAAAARAARARRHHAVVARWRRDRGARCAAGRGPRAALHACRAPRLAAPGAPAGEPPLSAGAVARVVVAGSRYALPGVPAPGARGPAAARCGAWRGGQRHA